MRRGFLAVAACPERATRVERAARFLSLAVKFIVYEAITCIIWAIIIACAGYYFGRAVESVLGRAAHIEKYGLLILVLVGIGLFVWHQFKDRRRPPAD